MNQTSQRTPLTFNQNKSLSIYALGETDTNRTLQGRQDFKAPRHISAATSFILMHVCAAANSSALT